MTPEFKAKWVDALRSGKYTQARHVMKDENGCMCCLGVAADLLDPSKWDPALSGYAEERGFGWDGEGPVQCGAIARALEINLMDVKQLACRNDGNSGYEPHTFAQIADIIESRF